MVPAAIDLLQELGEAGSLPTRPSDSGDIFESGNHVETCLLPRSQIWCRINRSLLSGQDKVAGDDYKHALGQFETSEDFALYSLRLFGVPGTLV